MKKTINLKFKNKNGKIEEEKFEKNIRNELHFEIQKNNSAKVFKDKTKYSRKQKHKNKEDIF